MIDQCTILIQGVIFKLHLKRDVVTAYVALYTVYHRVVQEASGVTLLYMNIVVHNTINCACA